MDLSEDEESRRLRRRDAKRANIEHLLQAPNNRSELKSLLPIFTAQRVEGIVRDFASHAAENQQLLNRVDAHDAYHQEISKDLEGIHADCQSLAPLVSQCQVSIQTLDASLETLDNRMSEKSANDAKHAADLKSTDKVVRTLHEQADHMQKQLDKAHHDQAKLLDAAKIADASLTRLDAKLEDASREFNKVSSELKAGMAQTARDYEGVHKFLQRLLPMEEQLFQLLDKHVMSDVSTVPEPPTQTTPDMGDEHDAPTNMVVDRDAPSNDGDENDVPDIHAFNEIYDVYRKSYKERKPKSDAKFIKSLLRNCDPIIAHLWQEVLLQSFPHRVTLVEHDSLYARRHDVIFTKFETFSWKQFQAALYKMELVEMQRAIDEVKGTVRTRKRPAPPTHLEVPTKKFRSGRDTVTQT
ncbi:Uu.00g046720.m01.CDS01 [Anthostomella pinea]|uniref:Uu.00g046720.m01.CDS01 n=1 Tax=Anthostomella pinea TaxID=933095 RepID=A0AAI8VBA3_9PEZI|nr:Uu.00g046720.m01.CDS01 [Anthostomella pinea]